METETRNKRIDILKGIAVLAVLFGHAIQRGLITGYLDNFFFKIIYSFHMPLFMVLSGYTLFKYTKNYDFKLIKRKFMRLILPTLIWSYLIYYMRNFWFVGIKEFVPFPDSFIEYSKLLIKFPDYIIWFLYIIFLCTMIYIIIFYVSKSFGLKWKRLISLLFAIIFSIGIQFIPTTYFGITRLKIYFPLFSLGYYLDYVLEIIKKYLKFIVLLCILLYIIVFPYFNVLIDNLIIYYVISISAMIIIYSLVVWINNEKIEKFLICFGKKSLEIYLCQCLCLNIGIGTGYIRVISIFVTATILSYMLSILTKKCSFTGLLLYGSIKQNNKK